MKKRLLAILLTVCMVLSMAPAALAADTVFTDVDTDDWFAEEVGYVYDNGLMNGVGDNKFDPNGTVTRAMVWTTLARLAGVDTSGGDPWWLAGQQWAMENEVSDGTMAADNITREQLVTMLYRYAQYIDMDVSVGEDTSILSYTDAFSVNEWAVSAMQWACGAGIINGIDGALQPQGYATRAQLAAILYRFVDMLASAGEAAEEYTVTFMYNYGSKDVYKEITVKDGQTVDKPRDPSRGGYSFGGWYTNAKTTKRFDFDTKITGDVVLYAKWSSTSSYDEHYHNYTAAVTAPTCTERGHSTYTCRCGDSYVGDYVDALGHAWGDWTSNGDGTHTRACSACGETAAEDCVLSGYAACPTCGYADSSYHISSVADLTAFAAAVNGGDDFEGKTVVLDADIDLADVAWIPIGNAENSFNGTFDGQGNTISNLTVTGTEFVGLFGRGWTESSIENVDLEDVVIEGNHFVGAVIGHTYGDVKNCSVDGLKITVVPNEVSGGYDNGDKVGGIAGWAACGEISDCSVANGAIAAYRDVGGILGASIADNTNTTVTGCAVSDVTITVDQTQYSYGYKQPNAGEIVGRIDGEAALSGNTATNVEININATADGEIIVADVNGTPYTDLREAVDAADESGATVTMLADATVAGGSGGYGVAGIVHNGATLDGNGNELTVTGANDTWNCAIYTTGGTIKNLTIGGAFRGIFTAGCSSDIIIDNVTIDDVCYTISSDGSNPDYSIIVTDSTLNGWTSYTGGYKSVSFTDCSFGKGTGAYTYAYMRPYSETTFTNCEFEAGFKLDASRCTSYLNNCTVGGVELTIYNLTELLGEGAANAIVNGQQILADGLIYAEATKTFEVYNESGLEELPAYYGIAGSGDQTVKITADLDMTDVEWSPIAVDGYHGADIMTVEGGDHTISNLSAPLFAGGFAGGSGIVIKDLTIADSNIVSTNTIGSGAFIESVDSMDTITLDNCHLLNSTVTGGEGSRTGGLIGWTAGYNNANDGPVKTYVTITDCSVIGNTISCNGSVGGIYGHAGNNAWTYSRVDNCTVQNNTLISTDDGGWRVGVVVGTANVGEMTISDITESGNTLTQGDKSAPEGQSKLYGRFVPGDTGVLIIDGVQLFLDSDLTYDVENEVYSAASAAALKAALSDAGADVLLTGNVASTTTAEGYGCADIEVNGGTLDGNGNTLSVDGSGDYSAIVTSGGTIQNLTIDDGFRAIFLQDLTEDIILNNVVSAGAGVGYAINTGTMVNGAYKLIATNCTFNGWSSFNGLASASFTSCHFGQGTYYGATSVYGRLVKPYVNTTFTDCTFDQTFYIDLSALGAGCIITLDNCTVNGTVITADNYTTLLETIELPEGRELADCVIFK